MKFVWDEKKRKSNISKHDIDFFELRQVFDKPMVTRIDDREDYGEIRWVALGDMGGVIVVLDYTEDEDTVRLISARRASGNETNIYFKKIHRQ